MSRILDADDIEQALVAGATDDLEAIVSTLRGAGLYPPRSVVADDLDFETLEEEGRFAIDSTTGTPTNLEVTEPSLISVDTWTDGTDTWVKTDQFVLGSEPTMAGRHLVKFRYGAADAYVWDTLEYFTTLHPPSISDIPDLSDTLAGLSTNLAAAIPRAEVDEEENAVDWLNGDFSGYYAKLIKIGDVHYLVPVDPPPITAQDVAHLHEPDETTLVSASGSIVITANTGAGTFYCETAEDTNITWTTDSVTAYIPFQILVENTHASDSHSVNFNTSVPINGLTLPISLEAGEIASVTAQRIGSRVVIMSLAVIPAP